MPTPKPGESEEAFVSRGIPIVLAEGTTKDPKQAAAICYSIYREHHKAMMESSGVEGGFTIDASEWLYDAVNRNQKRLEHYATKSAMNAFIGEQGGYLIPPSVYREIVGLVKKKSTIWNKALVVPAKTRTLSVPVVDRSNVPTTVGNTGNFGGFQLAWPSDPQTGTLPESEPTFNQVNLECNLITGYTVISNALLQDSSSIRVFLRDLFTSAFAWFTEQAFLVGNGVQSPLGMVSTANPAMLTVTESVNYATNLANMIGKLDYHAYKNAIWFIHPMEIAQIYGPQPTTGSIMPPLPVLNTVDGHIFGIPLQVTDTITPLTSVWTGSSSIALIDPTQYIIADREVMEVSVSPHPKFTTNQSIVKFVARIDGRPMHRKYFTLGDTVTTNSPYVGLIET